MAIQAPIDLQNNRNGNGKYQPLRRQEETEDIKHFEIQGDLKDILDSMDRANIRTTFKQASDPIHLAFKHIDNKPLSRLAKEFVKDSANDFIEFITGIFH